MSNYTYNYCCTNTDSCDIAFQTVQITKPEEEADKVEKCSECKKPLKRLGVVMSGGYLKVASMNPEGKREVLKKRSHEHFKKEIKERQHEIIKKSTGK